MSDRYQQLTGSRIGRVLARRTGLPQPVRLHRHHPGQPLLPGPVHLLSAAGGPLLPSLSVVMARAGLSEATDGERASGIVLDATAVRTVEHLSEVRGVLAPALKRLRSNARVVVIGSSDHDNLEGAACQQGLEGLTRSVGKELRRGATANLLRVGRVSDATSTAAALTFLLSGRSAYIDGQVVQVGAGVATGVPLPDERDLDPMRPLSGKVALVTGAARGIGAEIAGVLARDGALVVALDVPAQGEALAAVSNRIGGTTLQVDITSPAGAQRIARQLQVRFGGLDILVHNAGITRDKLLVNTDADRWDSVMAVNLQAQLRLTEALLADDPVLHDAGRVVTMSSTSGIAGNRGQTNYATSKAGVIGMVRHLAPRVADRGITVNAVAPGFIETEMTARMPFAVRQAGRRVNSLQQGGLPVDVAETVSWLCWPASSGITGQVVRVCGQSLVGA